MCNYNYYGTLGVLFQFAKNNNDNNYTRSNAFNFN